MTKATLYFGQITKYSLGLVLLAVLLQGSSCPWFCDTGNEISLSETQELVDLTVAFRTIMNDFIKDLRLILVPLVHDLAWGSTV